ncbi:hypothetical protein [Streptomyces wuyuanensis]|uniref:hypothetical protein n=1 Tax=Streptomyces wuyuanensis TaxID=1196353 RepID=UPI003D74EA7B
MLGLLGALSPDEGVRRANEACDDLRRLPRGFGRLTGPIGRGPCCVRLVPANEGGRGDLGDPGFTLRTYPHLTPDSQDRARRAIDASFGLDGEVPPFA